MAKRPKIFLSNLSPKQERPLAAFETEAHLTGYKPLSSLEEAKEYEDGIVILQGDDGGQIYLVVPAAEVNCSIEILKQLLVDLDEIAWPENVASMRGIFYERRSLGSQIAGGMGGGMVLGEVWIHKDFFQLVPIILALLAGSRDRIH